MSKLIDTIAEAIQDKKGKNIISLDLSGFDGAGCPAFVICKLEQLWADAPATRYESEA